MPQRRKLQKDFILADNTGNITTTASGYTVEVLRNGAALGQHNSMNPGPPAEAASVGCSNPGSMRPGDTCYVMENGTVDTSNAYQIDNIYYNGFTPANQLGGPYTIIFTDASWQAYVPASSESVLRLVLVPGVAGHRVDLWKVDLISDTNQKYTNPYTLDSGGGIETYLDFPQVDLYVTNNTDSEWYTDVDTMQESREMTPKDFGAAGDDTTDDWQALQLLLGHVGALTDQGDPENIGTIRIPSGTYLYADTTIYGQAIWAGTTIEGDGRNRAIVKWTTTSGGTSLWGTATGFGDQLGITIRDMTFEVDFTSGSALNYILQINAQQVTLERVTFKITNAAVDVTAAIHIDGATQVTLKDVYIDGNSECTTGILIENSSANVTIESCFIENVTNGVEIDGSDKIRIANVNVEGFTGDGMFLTGTCDQISFTDNIVDAESAGDTCIKLNATTTSCVVLGNNIKGAVTAELDLNGATDSEVQRGFNTGTEQA